MDFNDSPEEAAFRAEVREWLDKNAEKKTDTNTNWRAGLDDAEAMAKAKAWQAKRADARFAQITWPEEWGGRGGTPIQTVIYGQEESQYLAPRGYFEIGLGMCIPTMMAYATPEQNARFVQPALRGEEIWCQLFSEPSAGSDVAGLRTKAVRDGDDWVINGQKVWTSGAHYSDFGILLTRTNPDVPKHKGLTMFFLDMKSPGVECRPIKQMSGDANFNEVFFTDVRIPDSQRLSDEGNGWKVALTTLMNERLAVGDASGPDIEELMELARNTESETGGPVIKDMDVRQKIADWYVQGQGLKYTKFRTLTALSKGQTPGPEASISKVVSAPRLQDLTSFALDLMDQSGVQMDRELTGENMQFMASNFWAPGLRIAGGTDEILRNIIAERVLGLPGDVRVDKDVAYKDLPKGTS
ncbi:MAG: acyl-CoA dehydrogenase family protein [Alphaproteobacteria bacterium]